MSVIDVQLDINIIIALPASAAQLKPTPTELKLYDNAPLGSFLLKPEFGDSPVMSSSSAAPDCSLNLPGPAARLVRALALDADGVLRTADSLRGLDGVYKFGLQCANSTAPVKLEVRRGGS